MTSKEALERIGELNLFEESCQIPYDPPLKQQYKEEYEILLKLVERDTPMKVIKTQWSYRCPRCEDEVDVSDVDYDSRQIYRCCYHCGQKLDWSE